MVQFISFEDYIEESDTGPIEVFIDDHFFLSNFHPQQVVYEGAHYPTVEHAYQAAKFTDLEYREQIRLAHSPGRAKRLGNKSFARDDWDDVRVTVMEDLLRQKFASDSALAALLEKTGDRELVEGNTWNDTFWGVCEGEGQNQLGKLLMRIRAENRLHNM